MILYQRKSERERIFEKDLNKCKLWICVAKGRLDTGYKMGDQNSVYQQWIKCFTPSLNLLG